MCACANLVYFSTTLGGIQFLIAPQKLDIVEIPNQHLYFFQVSTFLNLIIQMVPRNFLFCERKKKEKNKNFRWVNNERLTGKRMKIEN